MASAENEKMHNVKGGWKLIYIKCLFGTFLCKQLTKEAGLEINEKIQSQLCNRILYQNLVAV